MSKIASYQLPIVAVDPLFPLRHLHAFAEAMEENSQEIVKGYQRLKSVGLQHRVMDLNIEINPSLQVTGCSKLFNHRSQSLLDRLVFRHGVGHVRQYAGFQNDAD